MILRDGGINVWKKLAISAERKSMYNFIGFRMEKYIKAALAKYCNTLYASFRTWK